MQAFESSVSAIKKEAVCHLLLNLKRQNIGTNEVEHSLKRLVLSENARSVVRRKVMSSKVSDAFRARKAAQVQNRQVWREVKKEIPRHLREGYLHLWREHIGTVKKALVKKHEKKVKWLKEKWKPEETVPDVLRNVEVGDRDLPEEFASNPRMYGQVRLSEEEEEALRLSPKFGLFQKLDPTMCRIDVEEALNKLRWNRLKGNRKKSDQEENGEEGEEEPRGFVDPAVGVVDVNTLRATDLPYNPRVMMPPALKEGEVQLHQFKIEVDRVVRGMAEKTSRWSNVTRSAKKGLLRLRERVRKREIVCFVTDKSGRWAVDTPENYKRACEAELADKTKTPEISLEDHDCAEKEMNGHALAFVRMLGINSMESAGERVCKAVVAHGVKIPPFYGMRKDHKVVPTGEEDKGPRVRPVCGAKDCVTRRLSYLLCLLLCRLTEGEKTNCESTEELLEEIETVNRHWDVQEDWVVGSLDVDALYPSLDIGLCAEVVCRKLFESDIQFVGLAWREIALYLRYHMSEEALVENGYDKFCPHRKSNRGEGPLFHASGSNMDEEARFGPWRFPLDVPDVVTTRRMFCSAIQLMIVKTMSLHDFRFDGKVYRQRRGGSIGLDLTGVISDIYMCEWDKALIQAMEEARLMLMLYKRYKDDVNFIVAVFGSVYQSQDDRERSVMETVKRLADSIDPSLTVSTDVCTNYPDKRLPVLDIKTWIGRDSSGVVRVLHTYYMKDVSSRLVMSENSSHGSSMRRSVMVNELYRVMRNCSVYLDWDGEVASHLSYYMRRLQWSGYSEKVRYELLVQALGKYDDRMQRYRETGTMYGRMEEVRKKSPDWYKFDGKYESVLFVEATPGSKLKERVQRLVSKHKLKILVVERAGATTRTVLQKSDPFGHLSCGRRNCVPCDKGSVGDCRSRGAVYEMFCNEEECGRKYRGTTGRSDNERLGEQVKDWERGVETSPLLKHSRLFHGGQEFDFGVRILKRCYGRPSRRLIAEAVLINELTECETMNSKHEWSFVELDKVLVS